MKVQQNKASNLIKKDRSEPYMKPAVFKKTAQVTVMMLIISILLPVLAFAATGFTTDTNRADKVVYNNNAVTGSVYSSTYLSTYSKDVTVSVYDPSGNYLKTTTASSVYYDVYNKMYHYNFSLSDLPTFNYLTLKGTVDESVYYNVYNTGSNNESDSGRRGGGGYIPPSGTTITVSTDGSIDANTLKNALANNDVVELKLNGDLALIPAKALVDYVSNHNKALKITNDKGTYLLPLYVLKLEDLAGKLGTDVDNTTIKVSISEASEQDTNGLASAAASLGATVASKAVDFNLVALGPDDKTQAIDLGSNYLSRTLPLTKSVDPSHATAVVYDPATNKLSFVPSVFSNTDSTNEVVIKRNSNSIYSVIELNKSFADSQGHWAQSYIELLANKLVIDGVTDTAFQPERNITRAEFAALVVRALGLNTVTGGTYFNDVNGSDWFSGVVGAAVKANIINGYEDNTFRPNQSITREELAAMVVRALDYAGAKPDVSSDRQAELLAKFKDANQIVWGQQELAQAIEAGIVDGITDNTIAPRSQATRAQSAAMLKRLLTKANFIN